MVLRFLPQLFILLRCTWVVALLLNRTIDDTYGDPATGFMPIYTPANLWNDASCSPSNCYVLPPTSFAYQHNYHAATYVVGGGARTAQLSFKGTAIYVYFILANNVPNAWTETFCNFILDGQTSGSFHHAPTSSPDYQYNALVYWKTNLANTNHILLISADGYQNKSFINFDYATYTYDDGVDSTLQLSPTSTLQVGTTTVPQAGTPGINTTFTRPESPTPSFSNIISSSSSSSSSGTISLSPSSFPSISVMGKTSRTLITSETALTTTTSSSLSNGTEKNSNATDNSNTSHQAPIGAIAAGVAALFLVVTFLLYVLCRRRRRTHINLPSIVHEPTPQHVQPVLTPFTSFSPGNLDIEARTLGAMPLFTLNIGENRQEVTRTPRSRNSQSSLAIIEQLQAQSSPNWVLGPTKEPPPPYST